jgi:hypothetical protein
MAEIIAPDKLMPTPLGRANIYTLKPPIVNEKSVRALARRLGVNPGKSEKITFDADKIVYSVGHLELTVYRASGGIRFLDRSRWQVDDRKSDLKMEDAEAARVAQSLVKKYRLVATLQTKVLKVARLRVGEATKEGKEASERTIDVAIALQRVINKIPVDGPGGKVIIYLDHERQMTGFELILRETSRIHKAGVFRSPQDAIGDMTRHFEQKQARIEIDEIRLGYFEEGWRSNQKYLQPAYVIFGMITAPTSRIRKRTIFVTPALSNGIGPITPPLERRRPQPGRKEVG